MSNRVTSLARLTATISAVVLLPTAALAQTTTPPATNEIITACYVPSSGSVYRIKVAGGPTVCQSKNHVEFSWNSQGIQGVQGATGPQGEKGEKGEKGDVGATGPTGPQGIAGVSGYVIVESTSTLSSGGASGRTADCPRGKMVLGGGVRLDVFSSATIRTSAPDSRDGLATWRVVLANGDAPSTEEVTVFAICATATP